MEEKGIHELKGTRKREVAQEERDQERETTDKYILCLHS